MREPSGRGTWSILWSCVSTIFICTWTVLHLNVPTPGHSRGYLQFRKIAWVFLALVAPEYLLVTSADHLYESLALIRAWREKGDQRWTLTHAQFACAYGFYTSTSEEKISVCYPSKLKEHIRAGQIDGPPISEDELKSRGVSDSMIKVVAILQIIWFALQTLFRAIGHYEITAIEIMTVAFVVCSIFTYGLYWNQPQNVEYPVILPIRDVAVADDENEPEEDTILAANEEERSGLSPALHKPQRIRSGLYDLFPQSARDTLFVAYAIGFGAIHCLAWNSPFPSPKERLAWRICSVASTALPMQLIVEPTINPWRSGWFSFFLLFFGLLLYIVARITIIVLAFMSLRALPVDAYQTVNWTNYIPHFL